MENNANTTNTETSFAQTLLAKPKRIRKRDAVKYLEYHIDEPIKKCVVGLALLGFEPLFSCCGFTYKGEKVKKAHMTGKPYIFLSAPSVLGRSELFLRLTLRSGWSVGTTSAGGIFDFYGRKMEEGHPWAGQDSPHRMEAQVCSIRGLELALEEVKSIFLRNATIRDGNAIWKFDKGLKHWQYEPTKDWVVTPEIFAKL